MTTMKNIHDYEVMAKINLPETERAWVSDCADRLIDSFQSLESIDTTNVQPLVSVLDIQNVLRDDVCVKTVSREELLTSAPEQYDGYFQVPKTLE